MNCYFIVSLSALALSLAITSAKAQEVNRETCQQVGSAPQEPIGDREGHAISTQTELCKVTEGPLKGGTRTGYTIWEWDGPKAKLLANQGAVRAPTGFLVYEGGDGTIEMIMKDGKPTGWTASGGGVTSTLATGSVANRLGHPGVWSAKSTGPLEWEFEYTVK